LCAEAARRGFGNVEVITCDINQFATDARFHRVVSVEMFEHLRNWPEMFRRVAGWLEPGGRFFMHVFVHRGTPYAYEERDDSDWMARHFFSGGMMPSDDLALRFQDDLALLARWRWDGTHYARTLHAWRLRFHQSLDRVRALGFDERFIRMWDLYLAYCEAAFLERHAGLFQMLLVKNASQRALFNEPWCEARTTPLAETTRESAA